MRVSVLTDEVRLWWQNVGKVLVDLGKHQVC